MTLVPLASVCRTIVSVGFGLWNRLAVLGNPTPQRPCTLLWKPERSSRSGSRSQAVAIGPFEEIDGQEEAKEEEEERCNRRQPQPDRRTAERNHDTIATDGDEHQPAGRPPDPGTVLRYNGNNLSPALCDSSSVRDDDAAATCSLASKSEKPCWPQFSFSSSASADRQSSSVQLLAHQHEKQTKKKTVERVTAGGAVMIRGLRRGLGTFRCRSSAWCCWILLLSSILLAVSAHPHPRIPASAQSSSAAADKSGLIWLQSKNNRYIQSFPNGTVSANGHDSSFYCKYQK